MTAKPNGLTPDSTLLLNRLSRRGSWRLRAKKKKATLNKLACVSLTATVSQATRDRLIADALQAAALEGMTPDEVTAFVNSKLDAFIASYPWWSGRLAKDRPAKPRTEAQRIAFENVRRRKAEIQREVARPYEPETPYVREETREHSDARTAETVPQDTHP